MYKAPRALASAAMLVVFVATTAQAVTEVPVISTSDNEYNPAGSADYLAWTVWTGTKNIAYASEVGGEPFRVSRRGKQGYVGGIDGTTLVYQEYDGSFSNIYLFDLVTHKRTQAVPWDYWKYFPSISGDWLLYGEDSIGLKEIFLYNMDTSEERVLLQEIRERVDILPGQVNGDFVVFEKRVYDAHDDAVSCNVYRYRISTDKTAKIANPNERCQFGPSVSPDGTVYFARAGFSCGRNASLQEKAPGEPASTLVAFEEGRDFYGTYAFDNGDGTTDVFYDPVRCGGKGNIFKVTVGG